MTQLFRDHHLDSGEHLPGRHVDGTSVTSWPLERTVLSAHPEGALTRRKRGIGDVAEIEGAVRTGACRAPPPPPAGERRVGRRGAGDHLDARRTRRQRFAGIGDDGALNTARRSGHDHEPGDVFGADGEIQARELTVLPIPGARLQLIAARRDVADPEVAVAFDAAAGTALEEPEPAAGVSAARARESHHPAPVRRSGRADHLPPHADEARGLQAERDTTLFLGERDADTLPFGGIGGAGEIRRGESGQVVPGVGDLARPQHAAHQIVAGGEPKEAVLPLVVGGIAGAGANEAARAPDEGIMPCRHRGVDHRLAELVGDAPADDTAARQPDDQLVQGLGIADLERRARLARPALTCTAA